MCMLLRNWNYIYASCENCYATILDNVYMAAWLNNATTTAAAAAAADC